jgi:hypothetical protein
MKAKRSFLNAIPRILMAAGVLLFVFGALTWENMTWRGAFTSVQPGTTMSAVESQFKGLKPAPRSCDYSLGGFWQHDSYAHLVIAGPNRWKYVFYLDPQNRVLDKAKWWN